jgi:hypothetical protein
MRYQTTVPQQALYLLNSPFSADLARRFVARPEVASASNDSQRIRTMFALAFQRQPDASELTESLRFVSAPSKASADEMAGPAWHYGIGGFDAKAGRISGFQEFTQFKDGRWQPGDSFPVSDARGYASITGTGGHPGRDLQHGVIRRWQAPVAGTYAVKGKLKHPAEAGDGVVGRIVSSRSGLLGEWKTHHGDSNTKLEEFQMIAGEFLDFVVDCGEGDNSDSFEWSPTISLVASGGGPMASRSSWSAKADFAGPTAPNRPLNSWERLAQALLASNEFVFVD